MQTNEKNIHVMKKKTGGYLVNSLFILTSEPWNERSGRVELSDGTPIHRNSAIRPLDGDKDCVFWSKAIYLFPVKHFWIIRLWWFYEIKHNFNDKKNIFLVVIPKKQVGS